jgi:hypothetical protein
VDCVVLLREIDIAVAAQTGIARPFVAGKRDELTGIVKGARQLVQRIVKTASDLEIVALMADHIKKSAIPRKMEIVQGRGSADGLLALPV